MKRVGQLAGVNSIWQTLTAGVPFFQPFLLKGDAERQGGIILYDVEVANNATASAKQVSLQFNHTFPKGYCTATPDNLPWVWTPPQGNSRICIPTLLATVADMTQKTDAPVPPIPDVTVSAAVEQIAGPSGVVQVKIHISAMMLRLTTGTGTDAPWF